MNQPNMLRLLVCALAAVCVLRADAADGDAAPRPNFLILIGDDCTYNDLPLYGGENVATPHIDQLASEGLTFHRAFLAMSMCNPCRTELYTGLYPARSVTDGTYHYVRNLLPDALYIEKHMMGQLQWHAYWPTWVFETTFNSRTNELVKRFMRRPAGQLYRIDDDPYEMTNLAGSEDHAEAQKRLSAELDRWMQQQGDPGAAIDTQQQWKAAREGKHFELK